MSGENENVNLNEVNDSAQKEFVGFGTLYFAFGQRAIDAQDRNSYATGIGKGHLGRSLRGRLPFKLYAIGAPGFGVFAVLFGKRNEVEVKVNNWIRDTLEAKKKEYSCSELALGYSLSRY